MSNNMSRRTFIKGIILAAGTLSLGMQGCSKQETSEKIETSEIMELKRNALEESINQNSFLNEEEKAIFKQAIPFIKTYVVGERFNKIVELFKTVSTEYIEPDLQSNYNSRSFYNDQTNKIKHQKSQSEPLDSGIFLKSIFEMISGSKTNSWFDAGINTILAEEYGLKQKPLPYYEPFANYVRQFCEIMGVSKIIEAYLEIGEPIIYNEIVAISCSKELAEKLTNMLKGKFSLYNRNKSDEDFVQGPELELIDSLFFSAHRYSAADDVIMKAYFERYDPDHKIEIVKTYFNETRMPNDTIHYLDTGETVSLDETVNRDRLKQNINLS